MSKVKLLNKEKVDHYNGLFMLPPIAGLPGYKVSTIIAEIAPSAKRIAEAHTRLLEQFALHDEKGPILARDKNGDPVDGRYKMDPARRAERLEKEAELMDAASEVDVPLLSEDELKAIFQNKDHPIPPGAGASLFAFVEKKPAPAEAAT